MDVNAAREGGAGQPPRLDDEQHALLLGLAELQLVKPEALFVEILKEVRAGRYCTCLVLEVVRAACKPLREQLREKRLSETDEPKDVLKYKMEMIRLGILTLDLTREAPTQWLTHDCNKWVDVGFAAVALVNAWMPRLCQPLPRQGLVLRHWVATLMKTPALCPSRLLRFVGMWPSGTLADPELCRDTAVGVFLNLCYLSPGNLVPRDRKGLLWAVGKVFHDLHTAKFLQILTFRATVNIPLQQVGHTERALAHLMQLMGQAASRLLRMQRRGIISMGVTIDELDNILLVLMLMLTLQPHKRLYEGPGMRLISTTAVATTASAIVRLPVETEDKHYFNLLTRLVDLFEGLSHNSAVRKDLRQHHGRCLLRVTARMWEMSVIPLFVPGPMQLPKQPPPSRFLDSRTKRLMEEPVRLTATGGVVDRTTLTTLVLLEGERRDLTFTPLPELQQEIQAWLRRDDE